MLTSLKRWIAGESPDAAVDQVVSWARAQGWRVARIDERATLVLDGERETGPVRVEWGPVDDGGLGGVELRVRRTLECPHSLQFLVLSQSVADHWEAQALKAAQPALASALQDLPPVTSAEDLRWLMTLPRIGTQRMPAALRGRLVAVASHVKLGAEWLAQGVAPALAIEDATVGLEPLLLKLHRGRLALRVGAALPTLQLIGAALQLMDLAGASALEVSRSMSEQGEWPTTASAAWHGTSLSDLDR